ncbi:MAG: hypothetical protein N3A38_10620 [Planctomycetota bacterium]|nr:hypothetical protein [Planctomycetota bacterium]
MALLYKDDWEEAKTRYRAWWAGECIGRCAMAVTAIRDGAPSSLRPSEPDDPEVKWTDLDYWARLNAWRHERTFFGGEAFPIWSCGYPGRENLAAFLGCPVRLDRHTAWLDPILTGPELDIGGLDIAPDNRWWRFTLRALEFAAKESRGRAIPSIGAFGASGDTLASLRGTERLLYDIVERPEQVRVAERHIMDLWIRVYESFYAAVGGPSEGSTCWFGLWSPGRTYAIQNDFASAGCAVSGREGDLCGW